VDGWFRGLALGKSSSSHTGVGGRWVAGVGRREAVAVTSWKLLLDDALCLLSSVRVRSATLAYFAQPPSRGKSSARKIIVKAREARSCSSLGEITFSRRKAADARQRVSSISCQGPLYTCINAGTEVTLPEAETPKAELY
jgi:hypothetical protein